MAVVVASLFMGGSWVGDFGDWCAAGWDFWLFGLGEISRRQVSAL